MKGFQFRSYRASLLFATTLSTVLAGGEAFGQQVAQSTGIEEVTVTATRQTGTVDTVPLSVTALTQQDMDQQGIESFTDLASTVPSFQLTQSTPGVANVTIRGISNADSTATAPTTGFYLDEVPLQKRNTAGFLNDNGTPLPPLFDVERVEVLRGPQGTLFGGSSEGGTVRYITPTPSLTDYSVYGRAGASLTQDGDPSYESGIAVGGPILQDKLGFRASIYDQEQGGYINYIDPYTGNDTYQHANSGETQMARGSLLWAPTDQLNVKLDYFASIQRSASDVSSWTLPIQNAIVEKPVCFNTSVWLFPNPYPAAVSCSSPGVTYTRPGGTFGPYPNLKPYDLLTQSGLSPTKTTMNVPALTLDYDFGAVTVKSITSLVQDHNSSFSQLGTNQFYLATSDNVQAGAPPSVTFPSGGEFKKGVPFSYALPQFGPPNGPVQGYAQMDNRRAGFTQELRFSSADDARPLSWVGGLYYNTTHEKTSWYDIENEDLISEAFYGLTTQQRYGVPLATDPRTGLQNLYDYQAYSLRDTEFAGYGEVNYWVTDTLKLIAGLRVSSVKFSFDGNTLGPASGFNVPTVANGGLRSSSVKETPVTPKVGVQYQLAADQMVYISAAKGYRPGGVNPGLTPALCNPVLSSYGLTTSQLSSTYGSDSVMSYEAGGKFRLADGHLQLNGDVYQIDWSNIQTPVNFTGCGTPITENAGTARSRGVELAAQAFLFDGLIANLAIGYDRAEYLETITAPAATGFTPLVVAAKGEAFQMPPWTVDVGARYSQTVSSNALGYVRVDWRWSSTYNATPPVGVLGYTPDQINGLATSNLNVRLGAEFGEGYDLNLFVNNLLNSQAGNGVPGFAEGGRIGCTAAGGPSCTTYAEYNPVINVTSPMPRQIGFQLIYRN